MKANMEIVKTIVNMVIDISVGTVVGNILHTTTPKDASKIGKIAACIGGGCISALVVGHAQEDAENKIDEFVKEVKNAMADCEEENKEESEDAQN